MKTGFSAFLGRVAVFALAAISAVLAGCGGGGSSSTSDTSEATTTEPGGVVRVAAPSEAASLDPFISSEITDVQVTRQINEGLYKEDESGKFLPWLAAGYKRSPDGLRWTFQLRKGVKFSDGKPMSAADVQFSIETARKSVFSGGLLEPVDHATALGTDSVEVVTKEPMPALIATLASHYMPVVPKNYGGISAKDFGQHPIGTGPFMLKNWAHGNAITLVKNPTYWKSGQPVADEVVFIVVPDDNSSISQFRSGAIDVIGQPAWSQVEPLESDSGIAMRNYGNYALDLLSLNISTPQFKDPRVREAVSLALDREGIVKAALAGQGEPAGSFLPPTLPYYMNIKAPAQDLAKAKELLKEAVGDGANPSFTLETKAGEAYAEVASQIIQQNLDEVGFQVKLQPLDPAAVFENASTGKSQAVLLLYYAGVADPSELSSFYLEAFANPNGMDTKALEALAGEAATEIDTTKRGKLYARLQEEISKEMQIVPVDYHAALWATQSDLVGLEVNSTNNPLLSNAGFSE